jgi:HPt (histidine-containing phosphotransfer) domain-containing protein
METEKIFDAEDLLAAFMNDREVVRSVLPRFIQRTEEQIRAFSELQARGDWETSLREAHTLKGSALTVSGTELGRLAERLEKACRFQARAEAAACLPPVEKAFARFREQAEAWLRGEGGSEG